MTHREHQIAIDDGPPDPTGIGACAAAGCEPVYLPTTRETGFLPDLDAIDEATSSRANLLICGYPNNPTGAVADDDLVTTLAGGGVSGARPPG